MRLAIAILLIVLIGLQYRLWVGDGSLSEIVRLKAELDAQREKIEALTQRNRKLEIRVIELQNGTSALEELARKDLGMIKKGEVFFQIIEPANVQKDNGKP